jgi:hypothetical protein
MSYNLPPLRETWVAQDAGWTYLFWRFNGGESGFISTFRGIVDLETAHRRHSATVRRFRRLQTLWRLGGKYLPIVRPTLLRALQS